MSLVQKTFSVGVFTFCVLKLHFMKKLTCYLISYHYTYFPFKTEFKSISKVLLFLEFLNYLREETNHKKEGQLIEASPLFMFKKMHIRNPCALGVFF